VLSALRLHPRDGAAHRLLLARAERLYEELLGAGRETLGQAIDRFDAALHAQDPEGVHDAARALATVLQRIEPGHPT
jgi:molecular chaperone HscC